MYGGCCPEVPKQPLSGVTYESVGYKKRVKLHFEMKNQLTNDFSN